MSNTCLQACDEGELDRLAVADASACDNTKAWKDEVVSF